MGIVSELEPNALTTSSACSVRFSIFSEELYTDRSVTANLGRPKYPVSYLLPSPLFNSSWDSTLESTASMGLADGRYPACLLLCKILPQVQMFT
jgi:hypothetical protein